MFIHPHLTDPAPNVQPEPPDSLDDHSKIPFNFAAIPHTLFIKGLDATAIGVYCGIARYINWKAQIVVGNRKIITGWSVPLGQQKLADQLNISRRTVIRKIQKLTRVGVIECKKAQKGRVSK